jgi:hypothetical protein
MPKTYEPITTQTLGSNQNAVNFTSIPTTYTDLILVSSWLENSTESMCIRVGNGSVNTTSIYSVTYMLGNGSTASSGRYASSFWEFSQMPATTTETNVNVIHFLNYSNTTTFKTAIGRSSTASQGAASIVGVCRSTAAINTIQLRCGFGVNTFNTGSTFTLYGVKSA